MMSNTPLSVASGAGNGGIIPPVEHRFKKGHKRLGNHSTAGMIMKIYINQMVRQKLRTSELLEIVNDENQPHVRRECARKVLEMPDLATFTTLIHETHGIPDRNVNINANVNLRTPDDRAAAAASASDRLRAILDSADN